MSAKHNHIFIAGLNRSGTTLLQQILRQHPKISGFANTGVLKDEGQHLQSVYPIQKVFGGAGKFAFDSRSHLDERSVLVNDANREKLFLEWATHWDLSRPYLLEKSPPNIVRMRFLQALFPASYFIIVVRHPVATGYATQKWSHTHIRNLFEHWLAAHRVAFRDVAHLKRWMTIRYEDFVEAPDAELRRITDWIGIEPISVHETVERHVNEHYFAMWEHEIESDPSLPDDLSAMDDLPEKLGYRNRRPYVSDWSIG